MPYFLMAPVYKVPVDTAVSISAIVSLRSLSPAFGITNGGYLYLKYGKASPLTL